MSSEPFADDGLRWLAQRSCRDIDIQQFFVDTGQAIDPQIQNVCRRCPVREECLTHAYRYGIEAGYFGGVSPGWRKRVTLVEALEQIRSDGERT
jgi:WhiB family redox-sensing transcriptional regulator